MGRIYGEQEMTDIGNGYACPTCMADTGAMEERD